MNLPAVLYKVYEPLLWSQIKNGPRPQHIGLIVDGNRRFARVKGLASNEGHNVGSQKLEDFLRWCWRLEIKIVTLYGFSTENHKRDEEEVDYLMDLILRKLKQYQVDPVIRQEGVKIKVIGQRENLSDEMIEEIRKTEELTKDHDRFQLNIAVSYGGRAEIVDAVKKIGEEIRDGRMSPEDVDENTFSSYL
ncbi:MAG: di-trans,poly-cis-decaprenylcistransferase, partial [Gammaproteobacteria bacterium]|nr:di-trans,poly-cis-decaprenylcistransferase [Gammaproteobacteria bacterium]